MVDFHNFNVIDGKKQDYQSEIASLTKIMTCLTTYKIVLQYQVSLELKVPICLSATKLGGTTANLVFNE